MTNNLLLPSRRGFLSGLGATIITAPAIVRAASLMPVRAPKLSMRVITDYIPGAEVSFDVLYGEIQWRFAQAKAFEESFSLEQSRDELFMYGEQWSRITYQEKQEDA